MAEFMMQDAQIAFGSYDFSGIGNNLSITYGAELVDVTSFNDDSKSRIAGYENFEASIEGFMDDGWLADEEIESQLGGAAFPLSIAFSDGTVGDRAYLANGVYGSYNFGGSVGEAAAFGLDLAGGGTNAALVRGSLMDYGSKTGTGNAATVTLGAVSATESVYASLHVVTWDATSLDVKLVSAVTDWGTPTDRITFTQATGLTSEFLSLAGAITDTFWRIEVSGFVGTSATIIVTAGIK